MKLHWNKWLYGLGSAVVGGGSGAVVSGFTNVALAPDVFNLTTGAGAFNVVAAMGINFSVVGFFSMFFYLKQSPLPEITDSNPKAFVKPTKTTNQTRK